jgi:hypothetical protein
LLQLKTVQCGVRSFFQNVQGGNAFMLGFLFIMETVHVTNLWKIRSSFWKFFKLETVQCGNVVSVHIKNVQGGNPFYFLQKMFPTNRFIVETRSWFKFCPFNKP